MIEIRNLSKSYGSVKVLEDINLKIKPGSFNMIVGGNGAGKSTLVNIVGSLLDRDSGEVILDGKEVSEYSRDERAQKISILKQNNNIDLNITVRDLVGFGRFPYSKGRLNKTDLDIANDILKDFNGQTSQIQIRIYGSSKDDSKAIESSYNVLNTYKVS